MSRKALIASVNYWKSANQVGTHHIAKGLCSLGWEVAFISDPISPLHILGGISEDLLARFNNYISAVEPTVDCVWSYVPGALITPNNHPILKSEWVGRKWHKFTLPNVMKKIKKVNFDKVDLLIIDSPWQAFWLDSIEYDTSFYRLADRYDQFFKFNTSALEMERQVVKRVDFVIYTAKNLEEYVEQMHPQKSLYFPNGVDFNHFADGPKDLPPEYNDIPKPIAVYVGMMERWFDFDLVNQMAGCLPDISFVLIGPNSLANKRLVPSPNLFILGRKDYSDIPRYLSHANVGLIPFNVRDYPVLVNSVNPLKLYEYMACGLPVVASSWHELETLNTPAVLSRTTEEFIDAVQQICIKSVSGEEFSRYAAEQDWSQRISDLLDFIEINV
ncbi:MAG: glycosyltransferase [Syntrophomonas sp.]